jgi:oligopeptide/dipeptide ABC transporter ATP-binding protein
MVFANGNMMTAAALPEGGATAGIAPEPADEAVLQVENLAVEFVTGGKALRAVDGVSFRLRPSRTVAVVGESGCGKSVTGLSIMGLMPSPPTRMADGHALLRLRSGETVDTINLPREQLPDIRGYEIAMIFQEPMTSLNPLWTIGDQVAEPLVIHMGLSKREAWERAAELLTRVGIPDASRRLASYPHELSGGMRQRVMIAMALACEPAVLIADEPTTALDVTIQAQILELLRSIQTSSQMAIMFITHDLGVVAEIAHDVIVMYAGQIVEEGPVAEILERPLHPYTNGLLQSLPRIDKPRRGQDKFFAIPGQVPLPQDMPAGCRFQPRCPHAVAECAVAKPVLENANADHTVRCIRWKQIAGME